MGLGGGEEGSDLDRSKDNASGRGPAPVRPPTAWMLLTALLAVGVGCRSEPGRARAAAGAAVARPSDSRPAIVFLGTSLTAGLGLDPAEAYPALIQQRLDSARLRYRVVNAGVSGETSAGALARVGWILRQPVAVLVIETGANDGLRAQDADSLRAHLEAIVARARAHRPPPRLLLLGMQAPPNFGRAYAAKFRAVYPAVAKEAGIPLVPFLLAGVAGVDSLNQADGIHPTAAGERILAANVWRVLGPMLEQPGAR